MMPVAHTLAVVIVLRLVQGAGEAVFVVAGFAMLADLAPPDRIGEALSYNSLGLYLGISFGLRSERLSWPLRDSPCPGSWRPC